MNGSLRFLEGQEIVPEDSEWPCSGFLMHSDTTSCSLAMLMMRVVVANLITNFDITPNSGADMLAYWDRYSSMLKRPLEVNLVPISFSKVSKNNTKQMETRKVISIVRKSTEINSSNGSSEVPPYENTLLLPDLFVSWASIPLRLNPNLGNAEEEAEEWFKEQVNFP